MSPLRWIIPDEPEKFPSVFLEQLLPAVCLLHAGQRSVSSPHRPPLPRGPVLLPAQPPPPVQPRRLAPLPSPPPSPPPPLLTRGRYRLPGLSVPTPGGSWDVRHGVRPAIQLSTGAVGEASSPPDVGQLSAGAQRLAMWPGGEGGVGDGVDLERSICRSWSGDWTQHGHRSVLSLRTYFS